MRIRHAVNAFRIARGFKVGRLRAAWLMLRFLLTGRTGMYLIGNAWREHVHDLN